jgi:hypothetical protein
MLSLRVRGFDMFKDGRNVPLSLLIAAFFLIGSLNWGFLAQWGLPLQMIWSFIYVYSLVHYRYTLSSILNRLIIVGLLVFFKVLIGPECALESLVIWVREEVPLHALRLPLQVLALLLDYIQNFFVSYLVQKDYLALLLLVFPGCSTEYTYWQTKDLIMTNVLDKTIVNAKEAGLILKKQMQNKIILKSFYTPIDTLHWHRQVSMPGFIKNTFGLVQNKSIQEHYCLPFNDFVSIRNLVARCRTALLAHFVADFSVNFSDIYEGLGKEMTEQLLPLLVQQSAYMISTNNLALPGTQLFSELLVSDDNLAGDAKFGRKSINPFTSLATQIVIGSNYLGSNLKILKFLRTSLDLALLIQDENGCLKQIGLEIKAPRNLRKLAVELSLDSGGSGVLAKYAKQNAGFDEIIVIIHTGGRFTIEEREAFEFSFYKRYSNFKLVFM